VNTNETVRLLITKVRADGTVKTYEDDVSVFSPIGQRFRGQGQVYRVELFHVNGEQTIYQEAPFDV
jgi:hypothetical protein